MTEELARVHAELAALCRAVGVPAPQTDDTVVDWADALADSPLAPRGSVTWTRGHACALDALEAVLHGDSAVARAALEDFLVICKEHGNLYCTCASLPPMARDPRSGRDLCVVCKLRRR